MTSGIDSISIATGGSSPSPVAASLNAQKNVAASTITAANAGSLHNPRVIQDPRAGFITEYLNGNGTLVVSQTPSAVTVAYLQQGLTSDGLPKQLPVKTTA
jgi:hypothetical protein